MKSRCWVIGVSLFMTLGSVCQAAPAVSRGVIHFTGNIVEPGCQSRVASSSAIEFNECPSAVRGATLNVTPLATKNTVTTDRAGVSARLVADSGYGGRYYNQRYELVDGAGKPVLAGDYLITVTSP
ncbi:MULTISPECIES: hypothetical protein [unclassified Pseudomonas]|uniref:hypothetical protein n=1 Tax=unclassified Pseudomonas TaxID=196821 RepID=UPI0005376664|nr:MULTISPECIES: hypothetical protein [unclassified Pseudomonas]MBD0683032.1 hypothetical protein [Pseudomonas sp. PSB18]CDF92588.1 hypothetical protein BN844_2012 [Pseudomonas sp. SHC52]